MPRSESQELELSSSFQGVNWNVFLQLWEGLVKPSGWADKTGFRPETAPRLLPNMMILEVRDADFLIRLCGTAIVDRLGIDPTNQPYDVLVEPDQRAQVLGRLWEMCRYPCAMQVILSHKSFSFAAKAIEALFLPFEDDQGRRFLLYAAEPLMGETSPNWDELEPSEYWTVSRRYFDLGFGVPEGTG